MVYMSLRLTAKKLTCQKSWAHLKAQSHKDCLAALSALWLTRHLNWKEHKMIRDNIKAVQIAAMKAGEKDTVAATRLIFAKLKDRDIEMRTADVQPEDDALVIEVLQKMVKQRRESIALYEQGNRPELVAQEQGEVAVIESFLPAQMSEDDTKAAIEAIKAELGASSIKDMGRVIATLKERHAASLDMGKASALVKAALG